MSRINSPEEITRLLNSPDPEQRALGYNSFLGRTHWLRGNTPDDLCNLACTQLQLNPSDMYVHPPRLISTSLLWSSQNQLEANKLEMVEAAYNYLEHEHLHFPPIVVWNFYESARVRMVIHDGHHRAWFFHKNTGYVNAVILEPMSNYAKAEACFSQAFNLRQLVVGLPVL